MAVDMIACETPASAVIAEAAASAFETLADNCLRMLHKSSGYDEGRVGSFAVYHDVVTGKFYSEEHTGDAFMPAVLLEI